MFRKCILAAQSYVPGEQPQDKTIIKLNTNENPFQPSLRVNDAVSNALTALNRYPEPTSHVVRNAISELCGIPTHQIVVGNGSDEILSLILRATIDPEDTVGMLDVTYSLYNVLVRLQGGVVVEYPTDNMFIPKKLPSTLNEKLILLASPNAPAGNLLPKLWIEEVCQKVPGLVVIDEAYIDFASKDHLHLLKQFDNVLITRTLSKGYALAGVRLGYVLASEHVITELNKVRDSYNVDRLAQEIAVAALRDQSYYQQVWSKIKTLRTTLAHDLEELDCTVLPSEANFLLVRPQWVSAKELYERLKEKGVLVRYFGQSRLEDYVRITIGTEKELDILSSYLSELRKNRDFLDRQKS
jgi:histidinol-phosphate aminotransferase